MENMLRHARNIDKSKKKTDFFSFSPNVKYFGVPVRQELYYNEKKYLGGLATQRLSNLGGIPLMFRGNKGFQYNEKSTYIVNNSGMVISENNTRYWYGIHVYMA